MEWERAVQDIRARHAGVNAVQDDAPPQFQDDLAIVSSQ
jgi:hypothetical protein